MYDPIPGCQLRLLTLQFSCHGTVPAPAFNISQDLRTQSGNARTDIAEERVQRAVQSREPVLHLGSLRALRQLNLNKNRFTVFPSLDLSHNRIPPARSAES